MRSSCRGMGEGGFLGESSEAKSTTIISSDLMEDEEMEADQPYDAKVHCSFNIKKVAEAFRDIGMDKQQIIQNMSFGGLLKLPQQQQLTPCLVNRQFSVWLMLQVDISRSEINLGTRGRIPISARDVNRVLGLPWEGKTIEPSGPGEIEVAKKIIRKNLMLSDSDALDLATVRRIIDKEYANSMDDDEKRCFAIAAVIYGTSYFLAPKSRPPKINNEVLPYLVDYTKIGDINWSEYVLKILLESCLKVQNIYSLGQASLTLDGCLLVLQIMYLDNLEFGGARTRQYNLPRVVDFRYDVIRYMIQQDTNPNTRHEIFKFGRLELRHPFETIYTRGEKYRSVQVRMQNCASPGSCEADVGVMVDFLKYFIENEKKNIRRQATDSLDRACQSMDKGLQNVIAKYEEWFAKRRREREEEDSGTKEPLEGHNTVRTRKNNYMSSPNRRADDDSDDDFLCPKPLEVIRAPTMGEQDEGKAKECHGQMGGSDNRSYKIEGMKRQRGEVCAFGRTKKMAIKRTGGKRNNKFGKVSQDGSGTSNGSERMDV